MTTSTCAIVPALAAHPYDWQATVARGELLSALSAARAATGTTRGAHLVTLSVRPGVVEMVAAGELAHATITVPARTTTTFGAVHVPLDRITAIVRGAVKGHSKAALAVDITLRGTGPELQVLVYGELTGTLLGARFASRLPVEPVPATCTLSGAELRRAAQHTAITAGRDKELPVFMGVHLSTENGRVVARSTDRYRASSATITLLDGDLLDACPRAAQLAKIAQHLPDGPVQVGVAEGRMSITAATCCYTLATIDPSQYPRITSLLHLKGCGWAELDRGELLAAARAAYAQNEDAALAYRRECTAGGLKPDPGVVRALRQPATVLRLPATGATASFHAKLDPTSHQPVPGLSVAMPSHTPPSGASGELLIGLNPHFLIDALTTYRGPLVRLHYVAARKPLLVTDASDNLTDASDRTATIDRVTIMPMRLDA